MLDCDRTTLESRIRADQDEADALEWRLDHLDRAELAQDGWLRDAADLVIDTSRLDADEAARTIAAALGS